MADIIQLLPESIANQIAAGEVIQRPASVVKELLENSIDAGSDYIQLIIKNAGKVLIQVIDNGKGMSETDARMSFERHATSKIRKAEDIFNISTKGFRGEALASIASIAKVELKTKTANSELGTQILIEGSVIKKQEYCETLTGTSIAVKNLFFNIPARRKFLKTDATELGHILDEFRRIVLAHPDVRFSMFSNDEELFHLPTSNIKQRVIAVFGKHYNGKLIPINEENPTVNISGFIGNQELAQTRRRNHFLFINNRFIKSNYLHHAVKNAYENIISDEQQPFYIIFLELDPSKIDINIHPTKQEVKFEDEKVIYNLLRVTVKHGLGQYLITPVIDFENEMHLESKVMPQDRPMGETIKSKMGNWSPQKSVPKWDSLYADLKSSVSLDDEIPITLQSEMDENPMLDNNHAQVKEQTKGYQIHNRYIIHHIKSGFILIDQNKAHQRILFEKYVDAMQKNNSEMQSLLFPISLDLEKDQFAMVSQIVEEIKSIGFDIDSFGGQSFVIRAVPSGLAENEISKILDNMINKYQDDQDLDMEIQERLAKALAKSAAVKPGTSLSQEEMSEMINSLFACNDPYLSPSGKKCFKTYELKELENLFK